MGIFDDDLNPAPRPKGKPPAPPAQLAKVRYTHDAIIDTILTDPAISQNELAKIYGFSATWISIVINSDAFQERMTERKAELKDPKLRATIAEKVDGAANRAMDRLIDRLDSEMHGSIKTQDLVAIAKLAVAPKQVTPVAQQNNLYVVSLPPAAADSKAWLENTMRTSAPRGSSVIIENNPRG